VPMQPSRSGSSLPLRGLAGPPRESPFLLSVMADSSYSGGHVELIPVVTIRRERLIVSFGQPRNQSPEAIP
jgi:hypothetical protein